MLQSLTLVQQTFIVYSHSLVMILALKLFLLMLNDIVGY